MTITLGELAALVHRLAPPELAYDWDNVGLQVGDPAREVVRVLVALEINDSVIAQAEKKKCDAVITHHPLVFRPMRHVREDSIPGRQVANLVRKNIGLIAAHTNLDRVRHGTNGALAEKLGLRDAEILEPVPQNRQFKIVVFVPPDYTAKVIEAIHRGGAGRIGNYTHCTFRSPGTGTYVPEGDAHPFAGKIGRLEQAGEERLEAVVPSDKIPSVMRELRQAHPYEEMACDVFPLYDHCPEYGLGLVGTIASRQPLREFARQAREACGEAWIQFAGNPKWPVKRVAIITGSAGGAMSSITRERADAVVTGELGYHQAQDAVERGIGVVALGHAASERIFAPYFSAILQRECPSESVAFLPWTDFPEPWNLVRKSESDSKK